MRFYDAAIAHGIHAKIVNTPQGAGIGCGLSVKCDDYERCRDLSEGAQNLSAVFEHDGHKYNRIYNATK